jgi:uncharacterized protein (DUF302 family)
MTPPEGRLDMTVCSPWAEGVICVPSPYDVDETLRRFLEVLDRKEVTTFAVVDHSGQAEAVGLTMPNTKLVIFGNPAAGTPIMLAVPLSALDLPLKALIWDDQGTTCVSYNAPEHLAARYHLDDAQAAPLRAVGALVAAATGS